MTLNLRRLKAERFAAGFTQDEMAEKMGWKNRSAYAKRESGKVPIGANELMKIISILGYSEKDLVIFFKDDVLEREQKETA